MTVSLSGAVEAETSIVRQSSLVLFWRADMALQLVFEGALTEKLGPERYLEMRTIAHP